MPPLVEAEEVVEAAEPVLTMGGLRWLAGRIIFGRAGNGLGIRDAWL